MSVVVGDLAALSSAYATLSRALDSDRIGALRDQSFGLAADRLRAAGYSDLAARIEAGINCFGHGDGDIEAALGDIGRLIEGGRG